MEDFPHTYAVMRFGPDATALRRLLFGAAPRSGASLNQNPAINPPPTTPVNQIAKTPLNRFNKPAKRVR
jgi:hypothetical protein